MTGPNAKRLIAAIEDLVDRKIERKAAYTTRSDRSIADAIQEAKEAIFKELVDAGEASGEVGKSDGTDDRRQD